MAGLSLVIWARCADPAPLVQLQALVQRLRADGDSISVEATFSNERFGPPHPRGSRAISGFLVQKRVSIVIWHRELMDRATLTACHAARVPVVVIEAAEAQLEMPRLFGLPRRKDHLVSQTDAIFPLDDQTADQLRQRGIPAHLIKASGSLDDPGPVLPYREDDRHDLAKTIGSRPVWLAAGVSAADILTISEAHKQAARRTHRLLCIVVPAKMKEHDQIHSALREAGHTVALREKGEDPQDASQFLLADGVDELGLWYRLSPISFMGGSQTTGMRFDPVQPASLGSVIVAGTNPGEFGRACHRLRLGRAVCDAVLPEALGDAITQLLSADRAAQFAHAGWEVTSSGAEVSNQLGELILSQLDRCVH